MHRKPATAAKHWSTDTYSVRERFDLGLVLLATVYVSVILALLRGLNANTTTTLFIVGLLAWVALGQVALRRFGLPRIASLLAGGLYTLGWYYGASLLYGLPRGMRSSHPVLIFCLGALFGYLAGGADASLFMIYDWIALVRKQVRKSRDQPAVGEDGGPRESPFD